MLLFWRIEYLDTQDKQYKDRDLFLDTAELEPAIKAAVETCSDLHEQGSREMLRYRKWFHKQHYSEDKLDSRCTRKSFMLHDYFEDENGNELTKKRMAEIITGSPDTVMIPAGAKQHDIDFMLEPKLDVDLRQVQIPKADLKVLSYFYRDFRELEASAFFKEGPGSFSPGFGNGPIVQTSVSDDEIRSFVTIFRRLYMANEPGNFLKAAEKFAKALPAHALGKWVKGMAGEYEQILRDSPDHGLLGRESDVTFTQKRLFDVFINTQYAHQGNDTRERQYAECLAQVKGQLEVLYATFLWSMWECVLHIHRAGFYIASFTQDYCRFHGCSPSPVALASEYVGMGQLEKKHDRKARILREKAEELAKKLWQDADRPEGGHTLFLSDAREQIEAAMDHGNIQ